MAIVRVVVIAGAIVSAGGAREVRTQTRAPRYDTSVMTDRFELLSKSNSGLNYVREKRGGVMRVLTESELADFDDPPPCPECSEQFGCEHRNCAGEPLLSDADVETLVAPEWQPFAKQNGVSREDLDRLRSVERHESEYRVAAGVTADMRLLEIVLLLNED